MVPGINRIFEHDGRKFHLQAVDLGEDVVAFEVRVYDGGCLVWQKRLPYEDLEKQQLSKPEHKRALSVKMEKTLRTVEAAIVRGHIG